jgi:diacylglycerol O-acyltransferase / wax synthase
MASERMSGPDAAWLHMDRPENLMIVNTVLWFDTKPDWAAVEENLQQRLVERHRRFRQRVTDPPVTLGPLAPAWDDAAATRAGDHIVRAALPSPGDTRALHTYVAEQASYPLDGSKPLWEAHTIDGYGAGAALLLRTHHAIGDGSALVEVITGLTDPLEARQPATTPSAPRRRTVDEFADEVLADVQALAKLTGRVVRWPAGGRSHLTGTKTMTWSAPIPVTSLKEAGRPTGSTLNDVVLAAVAAALRSLTGPGDTCSDLDVVVPIDLRPPGSAIGELGNRFGLAFALLPVASVDPVERLEKVTSQMQQIKGSRESAVVLGSLGVMGRVPAGAQRAWVDAFIGGAVAVVTNVKGPGEPVSLAGTRVAGMGLWVPSTGPLGIGVSALSYAGDVVVGLVVDDGVVPDGAGLASALDAELVRLVGAG